MPSQIDDPMPDAVPVEGEDVIDQVDKYGPRQENKVRILPGSIDNAASFEVEYEDHTLGNALRHMIMKNPEVEFCGYSIPHPAEAKMNIRIQTYDGTTALEALKKGLDDLMDLCDVVTDKFTEARDAHKAAALKRAA